MSTANILTILMKDHQDVAHLFDRAIATTDGAKRKELYDKINETLAAHTRFEEEHLYSVLADKSGTKEGAFEAIEEHAVAKHLLSDIGSTHVLDDHWKAKMTILSESVQHHVREEEQKNGLFDDLRKLLDEEALVSLAEDYLITK